MSEAPAGVVRGGASVYGAAVGILMLEARFPRIPGDMGNAQSWPFPVHYRVVRGASPERVVRHRAEGLLDAFKAAADELVGMGVAGITTNCGFLSLFQAELATHCGVPVAASSLMQYPLIQALLPPGKRPGILTVDRASLTRAHLEAAGVPLDAPCLGTEAGSAFTRTVLDDRAELDPQACERDMLEAATSLVARHPETGAILLECTNMPPYSAAVAAATGLPVFDITTFIRWFQTGLAPRPFPAPERLRG